MGRTIEQTLSALFGYQRFAEDPVLEATIQKTLLRYPPLRSAGRKREHDINIMKQEDGTMADEKEPKKNFKKEIKDAGRRLLDLAQRLNGFSASPDAEGRHEFIQEQKNNIKEYLADYLVQLGMSVDPAYSGMTDAEYEKSREARRKEEEERKRFMGSLTFHNMVDSRSPAELLEMLAVQPDAKDPDYWEIRKPEDLMKDVNREIEANKAERAQTKSLLADIKRTQSQSIKSKIKTFFAGNSKEYDNALKAMEDFSNGKTGKQEAKESIMAYLDIRKNKVRDQQYGRDRFDGFMKSLQSLMEPQEFAKYCSGVDEARRKRSPNYKGVTHPEDYLPEKKTKEHFAEMAKKAEDPNYKPTEREAARMMAITRLTNNGVTEADVVLTSAQIRQETDRLMNDPASGFKQWYEKQSAGAIKHLMEGGPRLRSEAAGQINREREKIAEREQMKADRQAMQNRQQKQSGGPVK